jgi:hypothetical protein
MVAEACLMTRSNGTPHMLLLRGHNYLIPCAHSFVDRYIPGYVFFADGVTRGFPLAEGDEASKVYQPPPWIGRGLRIVIGPVREVIEVEKF